MNEITDKRFVLMLRGNVRLWLNDSEVELLKQVLKNGTPFFEVQGMLISSNSVLYIVSDGQIEQADKIRKGDFKCAFNKWHHRGEICGHGQEEIYKQVNAVKEWSENNGGL